MTKQLENRCVIIATMLLLGTIALPPVETRAGQSAVPVEGVAYNVNSSMAENLKTFTGKRVYLRVDSGVVISGLVKDVGAHFVHLEKIDGKEYFDALIRIDSISAMDSRFRQ